MNKKRIPMSVNPAVIGSGGLASHGTSIVEQAKSNPELAAKLEEWTKEPAKRIAGSIGVDIDISQKTSVEDNIPSNTSNQHEYQDSLTIKKVKPWLEMEYEIREEVGKKGKNLPCRIQAELYAKTWFIKGVTHSTWDSVVSDALERYVNLKLQELGYIE